MSLKSSKKKKVITYPQWIRFTHVETGEEYFLLTQLYQVGIYGIWNNDPARQNSYEPKQLDNLKRTLEIDEKNGHIKNLEFGRNVKVTNEDGLWKEIKEY